ncbi:OLC1v1021264C1 [Oldenlandia corymbosa var. corymbosa]|uniref:OLC1v1021264C1 n=1 Tax=Oldenlandia corymbosa var. corymbosa TaxID=529605 RepID=A0AAV1BV98_OLDCO|nr:OLC1v1021264C1 [Oldenlandia corymbosa var. corymbosa]
MPKKRSRKAVKPKVAETVNVGKDETLGENPEKEQECEFQNPEVERQCAAIRALRDVEIAQLQTMFQLLRSYLSKEQLDIPLLQFFKENLPNLNIVKNEKDGNYEAQIKKDLGHLRMHQTDGDNFHLSLLHRLSMAYPDVSTAEPSRGGFEFSNQSVKTSFFGVDDMQIRGFDLGELSDAPNFEMPDKFQTPDVNNQRLSVGVTPKTKRLPKHGEVLLSVRGSPLGVYKEDNMEAIDEVEDG